MKIPKTEKGVVKKQMVDIEDMMGKQLTNDDREYLEICLKQAYAAGRYNAFRKRVGKK